MSLTAVQLKLTSQNRATTHIQHLSLMYFGLKRGSWSSINLANHNMTRYIGWMDGWMDGLQPGYYRLLPHNRGVHGLHICRIMIRLARNSWCRVQGYMVEIH